MGACKECFVVLATTTIILTYIATLSQIFQQKFDTKLSNALTFVIGIILLFSIPTIYQWYKLHSCINQKSNVIDLKVFTLYKSFNTLILIFMFMYIIIAIDSICTLQQLSQHSAFYNWDNGNNIMQDLTPFSGIIGAHLFFCLGNEMSNIRHGINDVVHVANSPLGFAPYWLFVLKLFVLTTWIIVIFNLTLVNSQQDSHNWIHIEIPSFQEQYVVFFNIMQLLLGGASIAIWIYCHLLSKRLLQFHCHILQMSNVITKFSSINTQTKVKVIAIKLKKFWVKYKFWNQNIMVIMSCISTVIGAMIHLYDIKRKYDRDD
eukprot:126029_1